MNIPKRVSVAITASIGVAAVALPRLSKIQQVYVHRSRYRRVRHLPGETVVPVAHSFLSVQRLEAAALSEPLLMEFDDPW